MAGTLTGAFRASAAGAFARFRQLTHRLIDKSRRIPKIGHRPDPTSAWHPVPAAYQFSRDFGPLPGVLPPMRLVPSSFVPDMPFAVYRTEDDIAALGTAPRPTGAGALRPPARSPAFDTLAGLNPDDQLRCLIGEHGESMYRVALSIVRHREFAEDVTQDALLKAWRALPGFRGDSPLRAWLLRITHNTAVSALRKRREEPRDPHLFGHQTTAIDLTSTEHTTEHTVEGRAAFADFSAALAGLDELSKTIVVLREVEGLSYDEIAEALALPMPTVKTRLLRARRTLAATMQGWQP